MKYKVYEVGMTVDLASGLCLDKKNNDLMKSVYQAIEKNEFVDIHLMSTDGSKISENPIHINPHLIGYIWEMDRSSYPVHLGGKR